MSNERSKVVIWKEELEERETVLELPVASVPHHVGLDPNGKPCVWFSHLMPGRVSRLRVLLAMTGEEIDPGGRYLGTFVMGPLVLHAWGYPERRTNP